MWQPGSTFASAGGPTVRAESPAGSAAAPPWPPADTAELQSALDRSRRLLASVESWATSFAWGDWGQIDLPPEVGTAADQSALKAAASLYLASELEAAGLLPAVELLAGVFASGGLGLANGPAADKVAAFWRERHERFRPAERRAFFVRGFGADYRAGLAGEGDGNNPEFAPMMAALTEALANWPGRPPWRPGAGPREEARVRTSAYQLAGKLVPRSEGITAFAARDILDTLQRALDILAETEVQGLFGAPSVWAAVKNIHRRYRQPVPEITSHLTRGTTGQTVLAWLAEVVPRLQDYATPVLTPGHEVIRAATAWWHSSVPDAGNREPAYSGG